LGDLADDRFVFRAATTESDADRLASNRRARLIAMAIVFVGLCTLAAGVSDDRVAVRVVLYVAAAASLGALALIWRRLD
jgi:hypothetical protein